MSLDNKIIGFIGGGNMARAIAFGITKTGLVRNDQIIVSAPSESTLKEWKSLSVSTTHSNGEVATKSDIIFFTFKPYQLDGVLLRLAAELEDTSILRRKLFVSVLAGVTLSTINDKIVNVARGQARLIRVMPNTPVMICEGCSAIALHPTCSKEDAQIVEKIFSSVGRCEVLSEDMITAVTGLTGSGPAYVYTIIEALSDGAVKQGLPRNFATAFAAQTLLGASKMVLETKKHPGELKDEVCSAGGTTIHGIHALEQGNIRNALMNAVEAAVNRAKEMSQMSSHKSNIS